jgi:hypothetical protein
VSPSATWKRGRDCGVHLGRVNRKDIGGGRKAGVGGGLRQHAVSCIFAGGGPEFPGSVM